MAGKASKTGPGKDFFHYLRIIIAILMGVFIGISAYVGFRFGRMVFSDEPMTRIRTDHVSYELTVQKGQSVLSIGKDLEEHGIIENRFVFFVQSRIYKCRIAPGTYTVSSRDSSKAILKSLENAFVLKSQEE
ncbi:MAG: endolytic transglycosylase MltG [Lachnospiraceae bacterium]|nr:endolytic transglycosylase MltG [Lachnospiraceae bacterium]